MPQTAAIAEVYERNVANILMKRYARIDGLNGATVFLASGAPSFATGAILNIDRGAPSGERRGAPFKALRGGCGSA
jgi:hypothetical protein